MRLWSNALWRGASDPQKTKKKEKMCMLCNKNRNNATKNNLKCRLDHPSDFKAPFRMNSLNKITCVWCVGLHMCENEACVLVQWVRPWEYPVLSLYPPPTDTHFFFFPSSLLSFHTHTHTHTLHFFLLLLSSYIYMKTHWAPLNKFQ